MPEPSWGEDTPPAGSPRGCGAAPAPERGLPPEGLPGIWTISSGQDVCQILKGTPVTPPATLGAKPGEHTPGQLQTVSLMKTVAEILCRVLGKSVQQQIQRAMPRDPAVHPSAELVQNKETN